MSNRKVLINEAQELSPNVGLYIPGIRGVEPNYFPRPILSLSVYMCRFILEFKIITTFF